MTKVAERQAKHRQARANRGMVRKEYWIPAELSAQVDAWVRRQVQQYQQTRLSARPLD